MEDTAVKKEDRRGLWESSLMAESPMVRESFQSKTFRRRSANINIQRSIQMLDDAVGTPPSKPRPSFQGPPTDRSSILRHAPYTPVKMSASQSMDITGVRDTLGTGVNMTIDQTMDLTQAGIDLTLMQDMTTTNVALLLSEDPNLTAANGLYTDFMQCYQASPSEHQVFELIHKYEEVCADQVMVLKKMVSSMAPGQPQYHKALEMLSLLDKEKHTWQLIRALYKDRLETELEKEVGQEKMQLDELGKHKSVKEVVDELYERDSTIRQTQLVIDWLEHCAAEENTENIQFFIDKAVSWENTLHRLQTKKPSHAGYERPIVDELDPDAPIRTDKQLDDLDTEDENRLLLHLFTCVRSGQLEKAQKLCIDSGQAWRAATLEGWRLHHDPNYNGLGPAGEITPVEGNSYRDIWKSVCWELTKEPKMNQYEKAIYAVLSGNLKALLPVCRTWPDYVWAHFKVMLDARVEQELRISLMEERTPADLPAEFWDNSDHPETVFQHIEVTPNESVKRQANHWYCQLQKFIILGDIDGIMELMHAWTQDDKTSLPPHLTRFLAHFTLFLRCIGQVTKEELSHSVLEKYVEFLIENRHKELIATYVSTLPQEAQVTWYAKFLEDVQEADDRQRCLSLASESGLDIPRITKTVVENIRTRQMTDHVTTTDTQFDMATTQEDRHKIEAMDWLVFDSSQRAEAIKQANAVMRAFIALKKHSAAREVMEKLPPDSIALVQVNWKVQTGEEVLQAEDDNAIREFMCFKAYLDAIDCFNDWFQHFHYSKPAKPDVMPSSNFSERVALEHRMKQYEAEVGRWKHSLAELTKTTKDRIYNVLLFPEGWLIDLKEGPEESGGRSTQLNSLRTLCIPMLCFLLHTILHSTKLYTQCLQLADIIAGEEKQLYKVFQQEQLQKLLRSFQESSLALLNQNVDPLGYEMV